ncbi:MAG TPA: TrbC/VirB2 family protein [Terriglobales bacterium]|nr:TrbC/VirB2 family protein [Terriglobales bacterium]
MKPYNQESANTASPSKENNVAFSPAQSEKSKCRLWRNGVLTFATCVALANELFAQSATSPWTQAVQALQTAFTGPIATGLALVAIVVGGLMFAFGEGAAKRTLAGVIFGVGMAVGAVNFMSWLFP